MTKYLSIFSAALLFCGSLQAGFIPGVKVVSVSSEFVNGVDQRRATNLVREVGLYGDVHTTAPQGASWVTSDTAAGAYSNAFVVFNLGSVRKVDRMKIWNYNEVGTGTVTNRGVQYMAVSYSLDNVTYTTNLPKVLVNKAPLAYTNFGQTIDLGGIQAQYIRFNVLTNYGATGTDNRVGLSKVRFIDDTIAPKIQLATRNWSGDTVTVQFSEAVQAASATNIANYTLQSGANVATISSIVLNTYNDTVTLKTSTLNSNLVYTLTAQNVRDLADKVTFDSTPATIENDLTLWLKADAGVVADGSGFVSQWGDQSGMGNNAVQSTNGNQPTLVSGAVNGRPAIHFDGVNQLMEVPQGPNIQANRDISVFLVLSSDTFALNAQSPFSKCPVNVPGSIDIQITKTAGKMSILRGNGSGYTTLAGMASLNPNHYYLVSFVMRGTNALQYLNGNVNGSGIVLSGIGDSGTPLRLGIRQDAATKFVGNMAEVMMFRGAVSDSEKASIEGYLGAKYGISVVALEIVENPQDATAEIGKSATFWTYAIAGSPNISYQWQSNTVNIAGATNATYTTPPLTSTDNGTTYRVIVSTSLGFTNTSSSATLTVVADTTAPKILSATRKAGGTNIVVAYSEAVDTSFATNPANYSLDNGVSVLSAVAGSSSSQVVLTTSALNAATTYLLKVSNIRDTVGNAMPVSTAIVFPSNLSLWLKADSGVKTSSSGLVTRWTDQSPNGNDATQYEGPARRPVLLANSINGKPALTFNGLSNYLTAASSPSLAISGDITLYVVTRIANLEAGAYAHILGKTLVNQPASFDYYVQNGNNFNPLYRGNGTVNGYVRSTALPSFGVPHVMSVIMSGTNVNHYLDGAGNGSGGINTTIADGGRPLRIGSRDELSTFMNGEIAEVLIFNSAISASQRTMIDSYLGYKYFPFSITQQPVDASKLEGQTATFSVTASAGPAVFSYQWQKDGIDIPNATNATYTTPMLVRADNGSTYRAKIIPINEAAILSDAATLYVSPDTEPPTVLSAGVQLWNTNKIVVVYSEAVAPGTATNLSNYFLDNGGVILSATIGSVPNQVILTVSPLNPAISYSLTIQNVQDLFGNVLSPTTVPNGIYPASLTLWLKADSGVSVNGQTVATWADNSGFGNTAFSVSQDTAPLYSTTAQGTPALNFNGTNQYMAVMPSESVNISGDMTIYVVAQIKDFTSTLNEIGLLEKSASAPYANLAASFDYYLSKTTGLPRFYRGNGELYGSVGASVAPTIGVSHALAVSMNGQSVTHYLDGQVNGSGIITAPIADGGGALGIGTRNDFRPMMNGNMQEILLFNTALSDADRASVDAYLSKKYSIMMGTAPKISIAPGAGNTVVLSWPTPNLNFVLQSASSLGGAWATSPETVTSAGGVSSVTISAANASRFYRLHQE